MTRLFVPACLVVLPALAAGQAPSAVDTARSLEQKYERVKDFTADFSHTYEGGVLKRKTTEQGTVAIKKPGKMRWEYRAPEKKTFVSDGRQIYSYIPADKQAIVSDVPREDAATTAVLFLAGKGNLLRDFDVTFASAPAADRIALKLNPRQKQRDYDWLVVTVDKATMQIRALTAADRQGGRSTFQFTNYRENTGVADKVFEFKIPKGTDVIRAGSIR